MRSVLPAPLSGVIGERSMRACCLGVGGSLDVASGSGKRAPKVLRRTGRELLFRFGMEPRKRLSQQKIPLGPLAPNHR